MTLDDRYGGKCDGFEAAPESADWSEAIPELEWDDAETQSIASELTGRRQQEY